MFAARHSNGLYLVTSARVWIFSGVRIFTFLTDICRFFFKILTLTDAEFNSVSVSFTKTWNFLQFPHFSSIILISRGHFAKLGKLSTFVTLGRLFAERWDCRSSNDVIGRAPSCDCRLNVLAMSLSNFQNVCQHINNPAIVMAPLKQYIVQKLFKKAKKSHYLTLTTIWQRLAGNLTILPRSSW